MTRIHIQGHAFRLSLRKLLTLSKWQHELYEQHCSPCLANFLAGLLDLCWVFPYWFICYLWSSHRCIWSDELQTYKWWAGSCLCLSLSLWIKLEQTPNPTTILRLFWVINFGHFFCFLTNVVIFPRNPRLFLVMLNFVCSDTFWKLLPQR